MEKLEWSITDDIMYIYNVSPDNVHQINIPKGVDDLRIFGDYLDHFDIPEGIKSVHLENLGLKTLNLSETLECLFCSNNFLKTLNILSNLEILEARNNLLSSLQVHGNNLEYVDIRSNKFKSLDFNISSKIEYFNAAFNENIKYVSPQIISIIKKQDIQLSPRKKIPDDENCEFRYTKSI